MITTSKINKSIIKPIKINSYVIVFNVMMGASFFLMLTNWFLIDSNEQKKSFIDLQDINSEKVNIFSNGRQVFKYFSYGFYALTLMILLITFIMIFKTSNFAMVNKIN